LALLRAQVEPTPTAELSLHDVALEIGLTVNHSTYDTLYVAFALAMGAERVVVADGPFVTAMQTSGSHPGRDAPATCRMGPWPERLIDQCQPRHCLPERRRVRVGQDAEGFVPGAVSSSRIRMASGEVSCRTAASAIAQRGAAAHQLSTWRAVTPAMRARGGISCRQTSRRCLADSAHPGGRGEGRSGST
jgi:hypothetical protein